ncbi:MAG: hypothetical protein JNL58_02815 [Planctomyces sp.]|nr:hypothetical protein [Planctomyces sp.]
MTQNQHAEEPSRWVQLARLMGVDRAVGFAVLSRIWQLLTGPVTQILVVLNFTSMRQDYYFAFSNLIGTQIFLELGLQVVLISIASHEWSGLHIIGDRIEGDSSALSRLTSLGRRMLVWYSILAICFITIISVAGFLFLADTTALRDVQAQTDETISWRLPWLMFVFISGLQFPLMPVTAIAEGCQQLSAINRIRFLSGIAGTLLVWILVVSGAGLWALVGTAAVRILGESLLVFGPLRPFINAFVQPPMSAVICWRSEILPLQWRIAVQGILLWGVNQLPGLIMFRYHEGEATRLGMTWTILTALQSAALAWIETRRPVFGKLIAERRYSELDQLFFRLSRLSILAMTTAASTFCFAVWWIGTRDEWLFVRLSGRLLGPRATLLFAVAMIVYQLALCTNLYVRAHKRDPFLAAAVISSLTIASLEVVLGIHYGGEGVAFGYLLGISLVQVPLWTVIWWWTRRRWHAIESERSPTDGSV